MLQGPTSCERVSFELRVQEQRFTTGKQTGGFLVSNQLEFLSLEAVDEEVEMSSSSGEG